MLVWLMHELLAISCPTAIDHYPDDTLGVWLSRKGRVLERDRVFCRLSEMKRIFYVCVKFANPIPRSKRHHMPCVWPRSGRTSTTPPPLIFELSLFTQRVTGPLSLANLFAVSYF